MGYNFMWLLVTHIALKITYVLHGSEILFVLQTAKLFPSEMTESQNKLEWIAMKERFIIPNFPA